ncbi:hypothetical protein [Myceligenerans crystallogenes]|uniref:Secreted protein n=1 Tax=Myceligenerans crystallogenes TaxID=316335 RepID=A0ABP4ZPW0_9MICO
MALQRRLVTMLVAGGLVASGSLLGAAPAAAWETLGKACVGEKVRRCAEIRQNSTGTVYVRAAVADEGAGDWVVRAREIQLYFARDWTNPPSAGLLYDKEYTGAYEDYHHDLATPAVDFACGTEVSAVATLQWKAKSGGDVSTGKVSVTRVVC